MGLGLLLRRAVALLVSVGLLVVSVASVSGDDGDEEAAVAAVSQPAQLIAEIPEEYEALFPLEWGGGSLRRLIGKLAGRGCALDTLWVHDLGEWNPYSRYGVPPDLALNRQFIQRYEQDVPAGTLYATCADQPIAQDLQPTQIVADIPEEYDTMFELQWGGGSLLHFKGRLATMGCIANNISFRDPDTGQTHTYNQYNTKSTNRTNQQFLAAFEQHLPAGTIETDCYRLCEFRYVDLDESPNCLSFEKLREIGHAPVGAWAPTDNLPCTGDFHSKIIDNIFAVLPLSPEVCIVRNGNPHPYIAGLAFQRTPSIPPFIIVFEDNKRTDSGYLASLLQTEVDELCHVNQAWHEEQQLRLDSLFHRINRVNNFNDSKHGKEFIDIIGFTTTENGTLALPTGSIYRDIYHRK